MALGVLKMQHFVLESIKGEYDFLKRCKQLEFCLSSRPYLNL